MEQSGGFKMIYRLDENYFVRSLNENDLSGTYSSWFENQKVCRYNSHGKFFPTTKELLNYYQSINKNKELIVWAICHEKDGHIGNISLQDISFIDRRAQFAILLGEEKHWRCGVSSLAINKLLEHGFQKLHLEKIYCGTAANNEGMIAIAKKIGMREEGRRIQHLWLEGKWEDVIEFAILRKEWLSGK